MSTMNLPDTFQIDPATMRQHAGAAAQLLKALANEKQPLSPGAGLQTLGNSLQQPAGAGLLQTGPRQFPADSA